VCRVDTKNCALVGQRTSPNFKCIGPGLPNIANPAATDAEKIQIYEDWLTKVKSKPLLSKEACCKRATPKGNTIGPAGLCEPWRHGTVCSAAASQAAIGHMTAVGSEACTKSIAILGGHGTFHWGHICKCFKAIDKIVVEAFDCTIDNFNPYQALQGYCS